MAVCVLVALAVATLEYFLQTDNFSLAYVAAHSNTALPWYYKLAALWYGQEGSLLWWRFLLSFYVFFALFLKRKRHPWRIAYFGFILGRVQIFCFFLNNFIESSFRILV